MEKNKLSRRQLFSKLLIKLSEKASKSDPLFEKYSRKIYNGRRYSSLTGSKEKLTAKLLETDRVSPVTSGLTLYTGTWTTAEALHLLRRTGFGFKKTDVDTLTSLPFVDAVNLVLNVTSQPAPPVNFYNNTFADQNGLPYGADWTKDVFISGDYDIGGKTNELRINSLASWSLGQAFNNGITIREKMTLFWYHFIPIDFETVRNAPHNYVTTNSARICYDYMTNFRVNGTGNFKTLIRNIATQPAMMYYLNNQANTKTAPDENFAREVMELFTIGKDVTNSYTQDDVIQAAKVLTGWRVQNLNEYPTTTTFNATKHETSNKQFSAFFGNAIIANSGQAELDLFIDMIFANSKVVSEYICRRLYRFFVYYDIDVAIETNVIVPLAQFFVASNWDIAPVLDKLFKSQHFYDMANRGVYIKSPFDLIVGFMRTFDLNYNVADATNHEAQYDIWNQFNYALFEMEQMMGKIPNVAGWQAFYQKPSFHEYWINSNSIQRRYGLIEYMMYGFDITQNGLTTRIEVDAIAFVQQFPNAVCQDPNLLVSECIKYLLPIDLSLAQKNTIKTQSLLTGQTTDGYWTNAWADYLSDTNNMSNKTIVQTRLRSLLLTLVEYAEYQLM